MGYANINGPYHSSFQQQFYSIQNPQRTETSHFDLNTTGLYQQPGNVKQEGSKEKENGSAPTPMDYPPPSGATNLEIKSGGSKLHLPLPSHNGFKSAIGIQQKDTAIDAGTPLEPSGGSGINNSNGLKKSQFAPPPSKKASTSKEAVFDLGIESQFKTPNTPAAKPPGMLNVATSAPAEKAADNNKPKTPLAVTPSSKRSSPYQPSPIITNGNNLCIWSTQEMLKAYKASPIGKSTPYENPGDMEKTQGAPGPTQI